MVSHYRTYLQENFSPTCLEEEGEILSGSLSLSGLEGRVGGGD